MRHTGPQVSDPKALTEIESRNALLQFDEVGKLVRARKPRLDLAPADVCALQKIAVQGIFPCAGTFRQVPIKIENAPHTPPPFEDVPRLVSEMCDYANAHATESFHVASYLMWRLNWIHPFADGNGRTSRAVSYLALSCGLNLEIPGTVTIPDLIVRDRSDYYAALDAADDAYSKGGRIDVSAMEKLMMKLLAEQLRSAIQAQSN